MNDAVKDFAKKGAENESAAHVQAENPVADTNEVTPAEPTAVKEKKNRRKNPNQRQLKERTEPYGRSDGGFFERGAVLPHRLLMLQMLIRQNRL